VFRYRGAETAPIRERAGKAYAPWVLGRFRSTEVGFCFLLFFYLLYFTLLYLISAISAHSHHTRDTRPPRALYEHSTTDHRPDSERQPQPQPWQPPFFHLARQTPRSSVLVHFKKPAPWGGGVTRRWNVLSRMYWPVTHPGRNLTFKRLLLTFHFFFLFCRGWWRRGGCWLC
jgi:hypothetical protein